MENPIHRQGKSHFTSKQHRAIIAAIAGAGSFIANQDELLEPELAANNVLKIRSGMLIHHGDVCIVPPGTYDQVTYQNGTQGMKRVDLVVARYTQNAETSIETGEWVVIQGTPHASSPEVPAHTVGNMQNGDLVDDCPVFELHFDGINVTEVKKLLEISTDINKLNSDTNSAFNNLNSITPLYNDGTQIMNFRYIASGHTDIADCLKESLINNAGAYPAGIIFAIVNASNNYGFAIIQKHSVTRQSFFYFNYWGDNGLWCYTDSWKQGTLS